MALVHYPVVNKNGKTIASAVTNLDLHDISRVGKSYGIRGFYVITPLADQQELVRRIVSHWISGAGVEYNPKRSEALTLIALRESVDKAVEDIRQKERHPPKIVATCARKHGRSIGYNTFRQMLRSGGVYLLVFGTAWGLTTDFLQSADYVLLPVQGNKGYNHLSVRSAAAIILDRLLGE